MIRHNHNHNEHPLTCETCEYFAENKDDHGATGQCRYDPPKVHLLPAKPGLDGGVRFMPVGVCPPIAASFWCGCYDPRFCDTEKHLDIPDEE